MYGGALHERARRQRAECIGNLIYKMVAAIKNFFKRS